jgi:hypothetical protein
MNTTDTCARPLARHSHAIRHRSGSSGFALVESSVGLALLGLMLSCMFATNAHILGLLKQGKQSTFATELLQERVEQLRAAVWTDVTTPANLVFLADEAQWRLTSANLPGVTETIRIEPLVNPSNTAIICVRSPSTTSATGSALTAEKSIKMTVTMQWQGGQRTRSRGICTVLTRRG